MSVRGRPDRPCDRAETERLLDAARVGASTEPDDASRDPLAGLLAAAAAPARPEELAGEEAALAAFRAARGAPAPRPARRRRRVTAGAVAWAAGVVATASAGAAFAAVTLERPPTPAPSPDPATSAPATDRPGDSAPTTDRPGGTPPGDLGGSPTEKPGSGSAAPSRDPELTPALAGLCRSYLAKEPDQREKALTRPGFRPLVTAAGGAGKVEAFCGVVVPQEPATPSPSAAVTSGKDTGTGNGRADGVANGNGADDGNGAGRTNGAENGNGNAARQTDGADDATGAAKANGAENATGAGRASGAGSGNGAQRANGAGNGAGDGSAASAEASRPLDAGPAADDRSAVRGSLPPAG